MKLSNGNALTCLDFSLALDFVIVVVVYFILFYNINKIYLFSKNLSPFSTLSLSLSLSSEFIILLYRYIILLCRYIILMCSMVKQSLDVKCIVKWYCIINKVVFWNGKMG